MKHPYIGLPDNQFWEKDPGIKDAGLLDPVSKPSFGISPQDRIVTAGSCFAQHIAQHLVCCGFNHLVTEPAHPLFPPPVALKFNFGRFSARYGNVYTARQLKQLILRAFGKFDPVETSWKRGREIVDPFRPQIQPGGFISEAELKHDREVHFSKVCKALSEMDVFIFTLGLTECWEDKRDGAIYPLAPGVAGGTFDETLYSFRNFDEVETFQDLSASIEFIRSINPSTRIVLTVSPVPLKATFESRHVLQSTVWSKAVLRIAAEKAVNAFADCIYFPSFEIITSPQARSQYFAKDCREVTQEGVAHVMRLFMEHFSTVPIAQLQTSSKNPKPETDPHLAAMEEKIQILCDEEAIRND